MQRFCVLLQDWGSLPTTLLNQIIRTILEEYDTVETIVRAYASLAQVCKHWRDAARSTLLCFHLTEPNHLGLTARDWLAAQLLEVLIINRRLAKADEDHRAGEVQSSYEINLRPRGPPTEVPFALDLFSRPAVLANSAKSLTCVVNVPVATAPLLPPFSMLRQVALYSPKVASRSQAIDLGALSTLPRLTCLSLIGYFAPLDWSAVPTTLRHLSVSIYDRDIMESFSSDEVATLFMAELGPDMAPHIVTRAKLPATLPKLEYLSVKADILLIDWDDLMSRCEEVHLSANFLGMGVGQRHDQVAAFATAVAEAQVTDCAVVAFHRVALYESVDSVAPGPSLDHWNVDVDDMLMELRQRAVCTWDMDPVMDAPRDFVNDEGPLVDCFVLTLDRQEGPEPRSFHFT